MLALDKTLRNRLERTINDARDISEDASRAALQQLGVGESKPFDYLTEDERNLRRRLRVHGRQLGDVRDARTETQEIDRLIEEVAYEHWHRMLFARFLAENNLLMYPDPDDPVAVTLEECEDLAVDEGAKNGWELAARYAARMLPQIFRPDSPSFELILPPEHQQKLEHLLAELEPEVFSASDSLGWVYQFWQAKRKDEVNKSEVKIGARELPAVTQLFTEPYMVSFLLDNSLGAWWAGKRLTENDFKTAENEKELRNKASLNGVPLEYLRFVQDEDGFWSPAAGTFDGWPKSLGEIKTLDPCCGSGHFLVAAFLMLVPMRMELDNLSAKDAVDAVLRDNLHGLELDQRCVELAAFALALTAWSYPDAGGYRVLSELNVACSGLSISTKKEEWLALAGGDNNLCIALDALYNQFKDAPVLGSLIIPQASLANGSLFELKWEEVGPLLTKALYGEKDDVKAEMAVVAKGTTKATSLLVANCSLILTNVPYRSRNDLTDVVCDFIDREFKSSNGNLATVFIERCLKFLKSGGSLAIVTLQDWLFQPTYKKLRETLLSNELWNIVGRLGAPAFQTPMWDFNVQLLFLTKGNRVADIAKNSRLSKNLITSFDLSEIRSSIEKASKIINVSLERAHQNKQLSNPGYIITSRDIDMSNLLSEYATSRQGISPADTTKYGRKFWEVCYGLKDWYYWQGTTNATINFSGRNSMLWFGDDLKKAIADGKAYLRGEAAFGRNAIAISPTGTLFCTIYTGEFFDDNVQILVPNSAEHISAIWTYCSSEYYNADVRKIDQALKVRSSLVKVPFDFDYWIKIAKKKYPNGLPKPYSNDPTQWIFHGHPAQSVEPLQVAATRLLGYRWPAELDTEMELSEKARVWVGKCQELLKYADEDGIVCIPAVRGELKAVDRLENLLAAAYGTDWSSSKKTELLTDVGHAGKTMETWLRNKFFAQHCKLFKHRPFVWHIWDGLNDGFAALVNYHKLEMILEGEAPYDIFVRWKPIEKQPIGWNPDLNDGIRLNIRPFMTVPDVKKKGAGILREKPNIKWNKDRGRDVASAPWYKLGLAYGGKEGDRINDHHLTLAEKKRAREESK